MPVAWRNRLYDVALFTLVILVLFVTPSRIFVNDDAFVYFNYARNFAEGRLFAYDPRNIPSEGFTSMLFMLLLVPAEVLKINPVFASSLINSIAIALSLVWLGWMARSLSFLSAHATTLFVLLLAFLVLNDQNIRELVFMGFESVLGLLCVTGIVISTVYALDQQRTAQARKRWQSVFFVAAFLAHLVRPEYLIIGAICGAFLLWRSPDRGALLHRTVIFALVMLSYYLFKLAIFGDLFPTGFYRKVRASELGVSHVLDWLDKHLIYVAAALISACYIFIAHKNVMHVVILLAIASVAILLFYTRTTPLVDFNYRFLIVPTWAAYTATSLGVALLLGRFIASRWVASLNRVVIAIGILIFGTLTVLSLLSANSLHRRAEQAMQEHFYIQLASHWKAQLHTPEAITLVFGDAGIVPYALGSRFIDPNGLVEPSISHLFSLPDGEEKTKRFIQHILGNQPDVILDYNWSGQLEGASAYVLAPITDHAPFHEQIPAAVYEAYRDYGMTYACSINHTIQLHVLIRRDSPQGAQALKEAFCSHPSAHFFPEGLVIQSGDRYTHFPPLDSAEARLP